MWINKCLLLLGFVTSTALAQKTMGMKISGKVTQTSSYCGGAAPSEEMLRQYEQPTPYAGKVFYVRKGNTNDLKQPVVLKFKSDSSGKFSFRLAPGVYSIIQEEQVKALNLKKYVSNSEVSVDQTCLKTWWKKPYQVLVIKDKEVKDLNFNFYHPCFISGDIPCMTYTGPMPP